MEQTIISYDECDKECICPLNDLLPKLDQINFVSYDRIDKDAGNCDAGVLAHNIAKVFPNMVYVTDEYLPNIQQPVEHTLMENDLVSVKIANTLKEKDHVLFLINYASGTQPHFSTVMNATEDSIEINKWMNYTPTDKLFLYGTKVDNYLAVNIGQVGVLGAACAKELYQVVKCQAETIASLQKQIDDITARLS
jgi:hypothetical protein